MGEYDRATSSERMLFVVVLLVIGTLVLWAAVSNVLGSEIGLVTALSVSTTVALVAWRDRLTFDVLSSIAFFGTPVLVGGLAFT